ncbi:MAG: hypothetical protein R2762_03730 [Bryobacteraceae bacterium]
MTREWNKVPIIKLSLLTIVLAARVEGQSSLRIVVLEGDGAIHNVYSVETVAPRIRVTDFAGRSVAFAAVTFVLPASGPGGTVSGGSKNITVASDDNGEASLVGMRLNRELGQWIIRVEVSCRGRAGSASIEQISAAPVEAYLENRPGARPATVARR